MREPARNGEPSSNGTPNTAMSASSASQLVSMRARRNDGMPEKGRLSVCPERLLLDVIAGFSLWKS